MSLDHPVSIQNTILEMECWDTRVGILILATLL